MFEGADLSGVEVIEDNRPFIKQARKDVDVKGQKMLEEGMETQVSSYSHTASLLSFQSMLYSAIIDRCLDIVW